MTREEEILIEKVIWLIEDSYPDTNEWGHDTLFNSIKEDLIRRADELSRMFEEGKPTNPWHKVSEELPEMAHFTADGDYSDLCVCINESGEHKILVLCEQGDCTYWAYGYDGEDLYDEELEGDIVKWMKIPKEEQ